MPINIQDGAVSCLYYFATRTKVTTWKNQITNKVPIAGKKVSVTYGLNKFKAETAITKSCVNNMYTANMYSGVFFFLLN